MSLFNANDAVCVGCLSTNRKLSILQNPTLFYYLLGRPTVEKALADSVPACWECAALLRRIKQFQIQVRNAGIILEKCMERSVKGSFSKLGIHQNYGYDFIIEETLPPDDKINIIDIKNVNIKIEKHQITKHQITKHQITKHQITKPVRSSKRLKEKQIETIVIADPHIVEVRTKEETVVADELLNIDQRETFEDSRECEEIDKKEGIIEEFQELNEQSDGYNEAYDFDDDSHLEADNKSFKSDQITKPAGSYKRLKEKQIETIVTADPHIVEVRTKGETVVAAGLLNLAQRETFEDSRECEEIDKKEGIIEEFQELNEQSDGYNEAYDFDDDSHLEADNKSFKSDQITKPAGSYKRLKEKQIETIVTADPHIVEVRTKGETVVADGLLNLAQRETFEESRECEEVEKTEGIIVEFEELNEELDEQNDGYNDFDDDCHLEADNISFESHQIMKPGRSSKRLKEKQIETIIIPNSHIVDVRRKEEIVVADGLLNIAQRETFEDSRECEEVEKTDDIIGEFEQLNDKMYNHDEIETARYNRNRSHNGQFKPKNLNESPKKKRERWMGRSLKKIFIKHPETLTYFTEVEPDENQKKEFVGNENPDPDKPWKCLTCMVAFETKRRLYTHHILKHDLERSKRSWFYFKPKPPMRTKANLAVFRCTLCRGLVQKISLQAHVEQFHRFRLYCEECDWSFWSNEDFKSHYRALHRRAVCDICAFTGKTKNRLETHVRKFHLSATCYDCSRVFRPPNAYSRRQDHRRLSHPRAGDAPERRYCVECDRRFPTSNAYEHHLKVHKAHIMQRVSYPCEACGEVFSSRAAAARACADHPGARRPCPHCPKRFANASLLKRHVERVHLKLRPPKDKLCPTCGRGFSSNLILKYHIRTHTQECPHGCAHCPAAFNQPYLLKRHIARHHPDTVISS